MPTQVDVGSNELQRCEELLSLPKEQSLTVFPSIVCTLCLHINIFLLVAVGEVTVYH